MKTLVIFVAFALSVVISNAQEVIELEEAKVEFTPVSQNIKNSEYSLLVNIKENYSGEFEKDPIAFMNDRFDINEIIEQLGGNDYHTYLVSFKSRKGALNAEFDGSGNKKRSNLRFKNVLVPAQLQHQLYRDHKGWAVIKTVHIAGENNGKVKRDFYKIKMKKGNQKKRLKINVSDLAKSTLVAEN